MLRASAGVRGRQPPGPVDTSNSATAWRHAQAKPARARTQAGKRFVSGDAIFPTSPRRSQATASAFGIAQRFVSLHALAATSHGKIGGVDVFYHRLNRR